MKLIFMGTPQFAVPQLEMLIEKHAVMAVVSKADRPNKRGNKIEYSEVKTAALKHGLPVLQPESAKDPEFIDKLRSYRADCIVVSAYGKLLPKEILNMTPFGCINVHGSMLPKYRGAAPIQWAIINGDDITGVTIMQMNEGLDTGDMIVKKPINIEVDDTYGTLTEKMAQLGTIALDEALDALFNDRAKITMQNDAEATYAPIIKKELGRIKWDNNGKDIVNLIRGLNPNPGAYTELNGAKLKLWKAVTYGKNHEESDFGAIINVSPRGILVNAANECVLIQELQSSGGKKLSAADYLRGNKVEKDTILI